MLGLLTGIRVTEVSNRIAAAYAGRLLADLGAAVTVVRIPSPSGPEALPVRLEAFLAGNKRRLRVEPDAVTEPAVLDDLIGKADIVLYDGCIPPLTRLLINEEGYLHFGAALCVVTPFGLSSPYSNLHDDELLYFAASGIASVTPEGFKDRDVERPMQLPGHHGAFHGGEVAAVAALQAWLAQRQSRGARLIDFAIVDCIATVPYNSQQATFLRREGPAADRMPMAGDSFEACADGHVFRGGVEWEMVARAVGEPAWLAEPFTDPAYRREHWSEIRPRVDAWFRSQTREEAYRALQAAGIAAFPVNTIGEATRHEQIVSRNALRPLRRLDGGPEFDAPASPLRILDGHESQSTPDTVLPEEIYTATAPASARPAVSASVPGPGLPLTGVQISDLSWVQAGPRATSWLGAMGAEVIKIESRARPDVFRRGAPPSLFQMLNYSKRSCTLNLTTVEGRELAKSLILKSGIVIENYASGAMERLGLSYEALAKERSDLIMVSCSGLGRTGPAAGMRAYGRTIHAFTGQTHLTRWSDADPPRGIGGAWADPISGVFIVLATLAGLAYRELTGKGCHFDISMAEATIALMSDVFIEYLATGEDPVPGGNRLPGNAPHNTFRCRDGEWIAIAAHGDDEWRELCRLTVIPGDLAALANGPDRAARARDIDAHLDAWCAGLDRAEALEMLLAAGVCAQPVNGFRDVLAERHYQERRTFLEMQDPALAKAYFIDGLPWVESPASKFRYTPAPQMGGDNEYVFGDVLGLTNEEIESLSLSGVLA
jgi:crotonobetainyl-CoA:carnitine CoA-transferase CaiB-like acyl-CoA transferase